MQRKRPDLKSLSLEENCSHSWQPSPYSHLAFACRLRVLTVLITVRLAWERGVSHRRDELFNNT